MLETKPGIYIITCISTKKCLIGETGNVRKRVNYHIQNLKGNRHENPYLQNAWNKYGYDNFSFDVLEYCEFDQCKIREDFYCKLYNTHNPKKGFNIRPTGEDLKNKFSKEHIGKIKNSLKTSEKFKNRDSGKGMRGKSHSEETRKKISESNLGKKHSEETKNRLSKILKGRLRKKESIEKQITTRKNNNKKWHTEETKEKMRKPHNIRRNKSCYDYNLPIEQLDRYGNFINVYKNADYISIEYDKYKVLETCNGKRKTYKKFIWKYKQN